METETVREIFRRLNSAGVRHALIGGLACAEYAPPRAAQGVDLVVLAGDAAKVRDLFPGFYRRGTAIAEIYDVDGTRFDIQPARRRRQAAVLERAVEGRFENEPIRVASLHDLIFLKLWASVERPEASDSSLAVLRRPGRAGDSVYSAVFEFRRPRSVQRIHRTSARPFGERQNRRSLRCALPTVFPTSTGQGAPRSRRFCRSQARRIPAKPELKRARDRLDVAELLAYNAERVSSADVAAIAQDILALGFTPEESAAFREAVVWLNRTLDELGMTDRSYPLGG